MTLRAVILAGGKGTRLYPYTITFPKPLMPVGDTPILEVVLRQLRYYGVDEAIMAVGHLAELLMAYFGDGEKFGLRISYSRETEPLGTAGPLALIGGLDSTFFVMNGDVLTTLNYAEMLAFHRQRGAVATIASHQRDARIDLGVIESDAGGWITDYIEKPTFHYQVSMGIYLFEPSVLRFIEKGQRLDFPDLVLKLVAAGEKVQVYPFEGPWLDIGRPDDYEAATAEFAQLRRDFLPE